MQLLYDGDRFYTQKPDLCDAVDTMGAGDAFISAFLVDFVGSKGLAGPAPTAEGGKNPPWAGLCGFLGGESLHDTRRFWARMQN